MSDAPTRARSSARGGFTPPTAAATVVICCYTLARRAAILAAVGSVRGQSIAVDLVVVVDHNDDLLELLTEVLPDTRVVPNRGPQGLSGARNTGLETAGTEVVLFLDDDARAEPDWAAELLACFDDPQVLAAGGRVEPDWAGGRAPAWFPVEFGWVVGCSYTGQPTGKAAVRNPIGASMALRRSAAEAVGGFSAELGRVGNLPVGCEETELCLRLAAATPGGRVLLTPAARVHHLVPKERQRVTYTIRRCYHEGRSKAAVARLTRRSPTGSGDALATEASYVRRVLPRALARHTRQALSGSAPDAVAAVTVVSGLSAAVLGFVVQSVRDSRNSHYSRAVPRP